MRQFRQLRLNSLDCSGLREAVRPTTDSDAAAAMVNGFCTKLYLAYYSIEADPEKDAIDLQVDTDEILLINERVSAEDGDWAPGVLAQTRQVLYELTTGKPATKLALSSEIHKLLVSEPETKEEPETELTEPPEGATLDSEEVT